MDADLSVPSPGTISVRLAGELDLSNVSRVESQIAPALAEGADRMIVDAGELHFADSSAIALWVRWAAQVDAFELRNLSPMLRRVLAAMGLERTLGLQT